MQTELYGKLNVIYDQAYDMLGFIGLPSVLLTLITLVIILLLNLCSPLDKISNYLLGIFLGVIWGIALDLSFLPILKYLLIMILPVAISYAVYYTLKFVKWFFSGADKLEPPKPVNPYYAIDSTRRDPVPSPKKKK